MVKHLKAFIKTVKEKANVKYYMVIKINLKEI